VFVLSSIAHANTNHWVARRLKWVHAFAACERWKEEVIRTVEEVRRLVAWHHFKVSHFTQRSDAMVAGESWSTRGHQALQHELRKDWTKRLNGLPQAIKDGLLPEYELFHFEDGE
jgi:hypothetical protein